MKLVDILARELKAWPENCECVWQVLSGRLAIDKDRDRLTDSTYTIARDWHEARVTRAEWQAAVDALNQSELDAVLAKNEQLAAAWAERIPVWNGEGFPPVGLDVEIKRGNCTWIDGDEWQIGKTATVMASFLNSRDIKMASVQFPGGHCECILARCLSPIRTAEQVAAEEREKGIQAIQDAYTYTVESCTHKILHSQAARLYDAGCRLQVAK